MKLSKIAHTLECDLNGDGNIEIFGAAGIEDAGPNDITFLANPKYADKINCIGKIINLYLGSIKNTENIIKLENK